MPYPDSKHGEWFKLENEKDLAQFKKDHWFDPWDEKPKSYPCLASAVYVDGESDPVYDYPEELQAKLKLFANE